MYVAVTGSRALRDRQKKHARFLLRGILSCYSPGDVLVWGKASRGVDPIAANVALNYDLRLKPYPATVMKWEGEGGFKERNMKIAYKADILYAIHSPHSTTAGTLFTYEYAISLGKTAYWIELPS